MTTPTTAHLTVATPNGPFTVLHDGRAVLASGWTEDPDYLAALVHPALRPESLRPDEAQLDETAGFGDRIREAVAAYYDGDTTAPDQIDVRQRGGPFIEQAWKALRTVAPGAPRTYSEFAELAGNPGAVRAAARACATNAAALFVPCHRIRRTDGGLGGFRYGVETKRWLLDHEG
ncbi:methylated-DNA--[protein]-cysteine S-methyltransferase [Gordonia crocea]|uniref:Putative methylated-DNA:protein-cysteine methyltransferase n=1 Tax=Gordonia crocea TaxID=589162 RepID=A0A7I9V131_9ACTN|nr:methylated-DNA--[protein]-cysteine S-methyltransferase [Gordonia crocea]GED98843.1 putative methylated-DNA:protein-cysteine methyltransferase [Gordonia crocea]